MWLKYYYLLLCYLNMNKIVIYFNVIKILLFKKWLFLERENNYLEKNNVIFSRTEDLGHSFKSWRTKRRSKVFCDSKT